MNFFLRPYFLYLVQFTFCSNNLKYLKIYQVRIKLLYIDLIILVIHNVSANFLARRFVLPKAVLENRTNAPENECFCIDEEDEGKCPNTGTIYLGTCYEGERTTKLIDNTKCWLVHQSFFFTFRVLGAPIVGSNPHFYNGDPRYVDGVEGMKPERAKHETIIILEEVVTIIQ